MLAYLLRRVGYLAFVVWGVGFAAFFISRVVPADPAAAALGANAREEQIEAYREQFGLNDPVPVQYVNYMQDLFRGDLGESLRTRRPIIEDLKDYFPATLELTLAAMLIALLVGIPAGIIAALYQNRPVDLIVRTLALLGGATPVYWLAIVMLSVFHAQLGVLPGPGRLDAYLFPPDPVTGMLGVDALLMNTGIAAAGDPVRMARAMKAAVEAGRDAFLAGRMPKRLYANASSPLADLIATQPRP